MTVVHSTLLILSDGDLSDAYRGELYEVRDEHGNYHDAPKLTDVDLRALLDGEVLTIGDEDDEDIVRIICPVWPTSVRQHHLGNRPAERLAADFGYSAEDPGMMARIARLRADGKI